MNNSSPPPFKRAGYRAEPVSPEKFNAEQEYQRGWDAALQYVAITYGDIQRDAKRWRELRESEEWRAMLAAARFSILSCASEWEALRKRVEGEK